jgi:hypothetical protein
MFNVFISTYIINTKFSEPVDIISMNGELVQLKKYVILLIYNPKNQMFYISLAHISSFYILKSILFDCIKSGCKHDTR